MSNRTITEKDRANAGRLKRLYEAKKKALGITQTSMADTLGMKQGAVAQYINGHIALNYEAVIRFARLIEVDPWDIDPELDVLRQASPDTARNVTVEVYSLDGDQQLPLRSITIRYSGMSERLIGFEPQSNDYTPFLKKGDVAVIDRAFAPEPGDDVYLKLKGGDVFIGEIRESNERAIQFVSYSTMEDWEQPQDEIEHCDPIVDIHRPLKDRQRRI